MSTTGAPLSSYNYSTANPSRLQNYVPVLHNYGPNAVPAILPPSYVQWTKSQGYRHIKTNTPSLLYVPHY